MRAVNTRLRVYRYEQGQRFAPHVDVRTRVPGGETRYSLMIFLNDEFTAGETRFFEAKNRSSRRGQGRGRKFNNRVRFSLRPPVGGAVVFDHLLLHGRGGHGPGSSTRSAATSCTRPNAACAAGRPNALLASGADVRVVQKLLGHTDIATTARYLHLRPDAERSAVERLEARHPAAATVTQELAGLTLAHRVEPQDQGADRMVLVVHQPNGWGGPAWLRGIYFRCLLIGCFEEISSERASPGGAPARRACGDLSAQPRIWRPIHSNNHLYMSF